MIRIPDESDSSLALADWIELSLLVSSNDVLRISDAEIVGELTDAALDAEGDRDLRLRRQPCCVSQVSRWKGAGSKSRAIG